MPRFRPRLTYANVMSTLAAFLALGGGAYAAVSSIPGADGVIHGCYQKGRGNLRLVPAHKKCARSEKAIAFSQRGPQGLPGAQGVRGVQGFRGIVGSAGASGAAGTPGARGEQGPPGPGASTFTSTLAQGSGNVALATLSNGITVYGTCGFGNVIVDLETTDGSNNFQGSGIEISSGSLTSVQVNEGNTGFGSNNSTESDVEAMARDTKVGKLARIDVHGSSGSPCTFWGMIIPSG
jgi:hypothetical protein